MKEELCEIGQDLWENYRTTSKEDLYKNYVDHIKRCPECIQKLGLTKEDLEVLNEDDLVPIGIKKFETITDAEDPYNNCEPNGEWNPIDFFYLLLIWNPIETYEPLKNPYMTCEPFIRWNPL